MPFGALAGKGLTDQEGFVAGLLCGAGFALLENLLYFMNVGTAEEWLFMVIGRAGTGVLHMFGSALMGWGLARTWREGKGGFPGADDGAGGEFPRALERAGDPWRPGA